MNEIRIKPIKVFRIAIGGALMSTGFILIVAGYAVSMAGGSFPASPIFFDSMIAVPSLVIGLLLTLGGALLVMSVLVNNNTKSNTTNE